MAILGIDVGGTFTDAVLLNGGELRTAKVPTARLPAFATRELEPGDVVRVETPGGGGYGGANRKSA